ncbi:MAG: YncE family protein [Actinomycetota bacterium]|nr:YncE family protein [Actinomycetota bacterium]
MTNNGDDTVSVIHGTDNAVTATIGVGAQPNGVGVDPTTDTVFASNTNGHTVSVIDGANNAVTATIGVGPLPKGVGVDPATHTAYVANGEDNTVSVITTPGAPRSGGLVFTGVAPTRVCDTRPTLVSGITDACTGQSLHGGVPLVVNLPTSLVPVTAGAVVANVTVTDPTSDGYLSVSPTEGLVPASSNLNFTAGQTVANQVTVPTGPSISQGGMASITVNDFPGTPLADVVIDVEGYDAIPATPGATAGDFHPLTPARLADTRCPATAGMCAAEGVPAVNQAAGTLGPAGQDQVTVRGVKDVPSTGVAAVVVNVTAVAPSAHGYLTVAAGGSIPPGTAPGSSSLTFAPGEILANKVTVPVGPNGTISMYNYTGSTDIVVDIEGWYSAADGPAGDTFTPVAPTRLADTRCATTACSTGYLPVQNAADTSPLGGQSLTVVVGGTGSVPVDIAAAVLNVVDVNPQAGNYLTVYPAGTTIPPTSDVNWIQANSSTIVADAAYSAPGNRSAIDIYNGSFPYTETNVVVDLFGYYTAPSITKR